MNTDAHHNTDDSADYSAHRDAQEALPWLANGTLAGAELERVQAHLQGCAACRADLAQLHLLRAAGQDAPANCDVDRAFARLLPRLDDDVAAAVAPYAPPFATQAATGTATGRVPGWRARLAANDYAWLRAAAAFQFAVIAVLGALLAYPRGGHGDDAGPYRALGAGPVAHGALVVTFRPDTPERELRRIVRASGARIAGGPTATGAWVLEIDAGDADDAERAATAAAVRLRAEPAVTLAEALAATGRP